MCTYCFFFRSLDHVNLDKFVGACIKVPNVLILSAYCPKGNLKSVLQAKAIPINWAFRSALRGVGIVFPFLYKNSLEWSFYFNTNNW